MSHGGQGCRYRSLSLLAYSGLSTTIEEVDERATCIDGSVPVLVVLTYGDEIHVYGDSPAAHRAALRTYFQAVDHEQEGISLTPIDAREFDAARPEWILKGADVIDHRV